MDQGEGPRPCEESAASAAPRVRRPGGQFRAAIIEEAQRAGIDPRIALSVATQESGIQQIDKSGKLKTSGTGAMGIMQLEPETARGLGVDPRDPMQNIRGEIKYLAELQARYHGDWQSALEAYYSGPGNVDAALKYHRALRSDVSQYAASVMNRAASMGEVTVDVGGINVNVNQPGASAEQIHVAVQSATATGIRKALREQTEYQLAQLSPSY
jgi:soluble lytic murein transglycosylase-like protein